MVEAAKVNEVRPNHKRPFFCRVLHTYAVWETEKNDLSWCISPGLLRNRCKDRIKRASLLREMTAWKGIGRKLKKSGRVIRLWDTSHPELRRGKEGWIGRFSKTIYESLSQSWLSKHSSVSQKQDCITILPHSVTGERQPIVGTASVQMQGQTSWCSGLDP